MAKFLDDVKILENREIGKDNYLLRVKMSDGCAVPKAGQFYLLKCRDGAKILKRAISLHCVNENEKILEFVYKITGKGTKEISEYKKDEYINIQGPLGKGFDTGVKDKTAVIIGGGIGLAPLKQLINNIKEGNRIVFIAGGRDIEALKILENFDIENVDVRICSDDGSAGEKAFVTELLENYLEKGAADIIYTCGPHIMMEKISEIAEKNNIHCEISMEERMACGVKACVGCSIKTKTGMKKVCHDGPVFDSKIIIKNAPYTEGETCNAKCI
ncbi:dihydroorotate dehydrogenase electron transfer subunit [Sebaldella sp. S0638]|uniref:dihydroorotate dehydrogenase electron transfer subunit n=1 Tax=Sebaldella sp. S0638 TaxID=2957809 RepID=UPI00209E300D|nr:dihydroorotate dehydrogenase electron transfer subunit [Sebaldella sp. S0638]MCP1225124.1 dihydroorotate dehydrogenase electron transfer subunit [Sebaldella sp. S0638]